jgi:AcrR family transcriptional regulator
MRKLDPVKHEKKRQEILEAAKRCFIRSGLKGASTAEICAEAKISPGHLYHYFDSKEAIIAALGEAYLQDTAQRFKETAGGDRSVVATMLSEMDLREKGLRPSELGLLFELFAESSRNPKMAKMLREHDRAMRGVMAEALRRGQSCGEIDPKLDPEIGAAAMIGLIDAATAMTLRRSRSDAEMTQGLFKNILTLLLAPPKQGAAKATSSSRPRLAAQRLRST